VWHNHQTHACYRDDWSRRQSGWVVAVCQSHGSDPAKDHQSIPADLFLRLTDGCATVPQRSPLNVVGPVEVNAWAPQDQAPAQSAWKGSVRLSCIRLPLVGWNRRTTFPIAPLGPVYCGRRAMRHVRLRGCGGRRELALGPRRPLFLQSFLLAVFIRDDRCQMPAQMFISTINWLRRRWRPVDCDCWVLLTVLTGGHGTRPSLFHPPLPSNLPRLASCLSVHTCGFVFVCKHVQRARVAASFD